MPRQHPREARRNEDDSAANLSGGVGSRTNHRSAEEILEACLKLLPLLVMFDLNAEMILLCIILSYEFEV